mmetsp:Transcript_50125/g.93800  ORF Transcript_50125/g.93800 Transcript_50125/m.93800 type:complete len:331 (-) Transcript_50125:265-1257(-)
MKQSSRLAVVFMVGFQANATSIKANLVSCKVGQCHSSNSTSTSISDVSTAGTTDDDVALLQVSSDRTIRSRTNNAKAFHEQYIKERLNLKADYAKLHGDCFGDVLQVLEGATVTECALNCSSRGTNCAGFSMSENYDRCILKRATCDKPSPSDKWTFHEKKAYKVFDGYGCVQHVKHESYQRFYYWEGYTRAQCQYLCDQDPLCKSFSHKGSTAEGGSGACYGSASCTQELMVHFGDSWQHNVKESWSAYAFHCYDGPHGRCIECSGPNEDPCWNWSRDKNPEFTADILGFGKYCASWELNDGEFLGASGHCRDEGHLGADAIMVPGGIK